MTQLLNTKIVRSYRRSISMKVLADSTLVVKAPIFIPQFMIDRFISEHQGWILKQREKIQHTKGAKKQFQEGEKFLYLGKEYILKIGDYKAIKLEGDFFLLPNFMSFRAKKEIELWYIKNAQDLISKQVANYAKQMNANYGSLTFSDTRSKWGTCFPDNRLQFSWRLIMAPLLVVNYVIVHELAHTKEKNHSSRFWSRVRLFNPSYKQQIKWLKQNGHELF